MMYKIEEHGSPEKIVRVRCRLKIIKIQKDK